MMFKKVNKMELTSNIVGKNIVIFKKDGFKKAGTVVGVDSLFIYLRFNGSGTVEGVPISEISHVKVEGEVM